MSNDTITLLSDEQLIARAIRALFDELGPVEAGRFLSLTRTKTADSVEWHRQWQATLDRDTYLDDVFGSSTDVATPNSN